LCLCACGSHDMHPPDFDGTAAMGVLQKQVAFGPRVPGTDPWVQCRRYLMDQLKEYGLSVDSQSFTFVDPYSGRTVPLVNIIASYRGADSTDKALLLAAHWDSRPRTDYPSKAALADQPIPGANDGASGVAVLIELARLFHETPPPANVDLVFLDGEDWGKSGDEQHYLLGARKFAASGLSDRYRFGILLDMIGDADLRIYREGLSEQYVKFVNDYVWQSAARLGLPAFVDSVKHTVLDDHVALNIGGIPTVDLIDFDYPYWHSDRDTPDKCSAKSLAQVGRLLAYIVYHPSTWPDKP
ncbi:MAG: M28 family peptidase, partial [Candidatus Zixiibacteriota bacterium]